MCYEGFYACKRSAESKTLKVHPVASKTLTQKIPRQNASLEISHFLPGYSDVGIPRGHTLCQPFTKQSFPNLSAIHAGYVQRRALNNAVPTLFGPAGDSGTQPVSIHCCLCIYDV